MPQSSAATAPPWLANHVLSAAVWALPFYYTEYLDGDMLLNGAVVYWMVIVALVLAALRVAAFAV